MKIAVSMPDEVFRRVERAAKRLRISRSELLSRAVVAFLEEQRARDITASYDRAFGTPNGEALKDDVEKFRREATRRNLLDVEW